MASGLFSSVTAHDCANGVPDLSTYNSVLMYTNHSPAANVFGDALANFVDAGGGVVVATYALSSTWGIGGRIFTAGYSPFANGPSAGISYSGSLVQANSHPVLNGVNVAGISYWHNTNYINPTLTAGSTVLARDANGINMVAVNASGRVMATNIYLNNTFQSSAELYKLVANQLAFVAAPSRPGGLSGAAWWSRAGSLSLGDNADIITWANDANSSKNLSGSATRPKFRNNNAQNINFNPVVEFTSTTDTVAGAQFFTAPSMLGSSNHTQEHLLFVGYPTAQNRTTTLFSELGSGSSFYTHFSWSDGNVYFDPGAPTGSGSLRSIYTPSRFVNAPSLYAMLNNATSSANLPLAGNHGVRQDGQTKVTSYNVASTTGINSTFRVGWPNQHNAWNGVLAEGMFLLGKQLTPTELSQLESYLGVKYGVTLGENGATATSYLNSVGGTIWTSNTGYHHNIVGLGRDDTTRLNQLISRSVNSGDQITIISGAAMPSAASVITPTTGATALATDRSYTLIGDNGQSATGTASISVGAQAGRTRSSRIWRLQMTGTVPTQLSICIPDSMLPSGFTSGAWATDLWLTTATSADFSTGTANATMTATTCVASGVGVSTGVPGRVATISNTVLNGMGGVGFFTVTRRLLDHIEITASSNSGVTCAPTTYTVKACGDAACTTLYTGGLTGTLTLTGTGVTSQPSGGAPFTIAAGQSSTTVSAQVLTVSTATVGATGLSLTPANAKPVFCGLGVAANASNACSMTVGSAGFLFSVPNHYAGASQAVSVRAVRSSDNAQVCLPAFANVTRTVKATCSYVNPSSGTVPVQLGAVRLNSGNTNSACDATGQNISLAFDVNGAASTTLSYWDAGRARFSLAYSGSAGTNDAGLSLTGMADFVAAPMGFIVTDYPSVATAGSPFSFNLKALAWGSNTNVLPNFGQESPREAVVLDWVRSEPLGSGAQTGSFTGSVGLFSGGVAAVSNASWSEVGRISPTVRLASGSYLSSGLTSAGNPLGITGWVFCANENGVCSLPSGLTAAIRYGVDTNATMKTGQSGDVSCSNGYFGDPVFGWVKACHYTPLAGAGSVTTHIQVKPARLEVSAAAACGSFSYAGQPFGVTVTAKNALNAVTQNYAGTVARTVNLSDSTANGNGTLSGSVPASAFNLGVASLANTAATAPFFSFTNKLTAPQTIGLRATDTDGVNSSGYDGSQTLRSGRLQMSNAFGGDKTSLQIPLQLQYWSGKSWVKNSDDTCTVIPTSSVVRAQTLNHNNSTATWSSAISSVSLSGGSGFITLGAPSPSGTGTVDLSINLGGTSTDVSCLATHPNSTGAGLPWLRSRQGSCASTFDRDPSARATFGVYAPETKRSVHVREVF